MASSQLECLEDNHINIRINDKKAEFYYCEFQRLALNELLKAGEVGFHKLLKDKKAKEFISSKEVESISKDCHRYEVEGKDTSKGKKTESGSSSSTYWPEQSDTPIPDLDLGWTQHVTYRGVTRATVHMHPPKNNDPFIKEIVRKAIQDAKKMIALVMDDFTDRNIFEDLIEACYRRRLPVYIILDEGKLKSFLEMCKRMELNDLMIQYLRVRSIAGTGLYLATGYIKGDLNQKFMIVDGDKVLSGSYSFTWSCSRLHRSTLTVYTGHVLENFDTEFRELYANSDMVNLHEHLNIKPRLTAPVLGITTAFVPPRSDDLKRKFDNPKYLLVSEGMHLRACSESQLLSPTELQRKESTVKFRERKGTMRDSKKEDHSKANQAVQEWLVNNDVRGLDEPEPLEDLVPANQMPDTGSGFKILNIGRGSFRRVKASQTADSDSRLAEGNSEPKALRRSLRGKMKDSAKSGRQPAETGNTTNLSTGKGTSSVPDHSIGRSNNNSKKENCVLS
ncbi:protein FAM83F-like [Carcharodon carcharias]|uniref:protein FAM83F-like n=1 Tax=Carcharodon carcharias TaxID=13397 RepID=UPI001B7EC91C|nr:protein FAM83F-like [Carcharodon carcharias]